MFSQAKKCLTGIKDVDYLILDKMRDKDLANFCQVNKYAEKLCSNEIFWKNRFIQKYGEGSVKYKPKDKSWKTHYSFVHYYIVNTGYTSRIARKVGMVEVNANKRNGFSINEVTLDEEYKFIMDKAIFTFDNLWGTGLYLFGNIDEFKEKQTYNIIEVMREIDVELYGSIVFRVDDENDRANYLEFLQELNYCNMYGFYDYDDSDCDSDYNCNHETKIVTDNFKFVIQHIDCESG